MPPPLRIAHILGSLDYGGVENMALMLLRRLPSDQFQHALVYIGTEPPLRGEEFQRACPTFVTIPYRRYRWVSWVRRLARFFRGERVDAVLCHNFGHHPWIGLAARLAGIRRVYTLVASSPCVNRRARWKNRLKGWLGRGTCALEIAVSPHVAAELTNDIGLPAQRVRTIVNSCMSDEIASRAQQQRQSRSRTQPTVIMVARLEAAKDHDCLLRAIALLKQAGQAVRLRLAGDGPRRKELELLAGELAIAADVEFLGTRHNIPELLGDSDIFVLASRTEGLSVALMEALSAGIPVISTDLPSCRELLMNGQCGLLVPPGEPAALAKALETLLRNPEIGERLVAAGQQRVQASYDPRTTLDQYARLLRGELDSRTDALG